MKNKIVEIIQKSETIFIFRKRKFYFALFIFKFNFITKVLQFVYRNKNWNKQMFVEMYFRIQIWIQKDIGKNLKVYLNKQNSKLR